MPFDDAGCGASKAASKATGKAVRSKVSLRAQVGWELPALPAAGSLVLRSEQLILRHQAKQARHGAVRVRTRLAPRTPRYAAVGRTKRAVLLPQLLRACHARLRAWQLRATKQARAGVAQSAARWAAHVRSRLRRAHITLCAVARDAACNATIRGRAPKPEPAAAHAAGQPGRCARELFGWHTRRRGEAVREVRHQERVGERRCELRGRVRINHAGATQRTQRDRLRDKPLVVGQHRGELATKGVLPGEGTPGETASA
mmetsp:Transcript_34219/g.89994  ORF Transcript_34219/g.89994 Transcript_34219/m.89994 type:complete len:258 (+) Transcript_34219:717-1490(+)